MDFLFKEGTASYEERIQIFWQIQQSLEKRRIPHKISITFHTDCICRTIEVQNLNLNIELISPSKLLAPSANGLFKAWHNSQCWQILTLTDIEKPCDLNGMIL